MLLSHPTEPTVLMGKSPEKHPAPSPLLAPGLACLKHCCCRALGSPNSTEQIQLPPAGHHVLPLGAKVPYHNPYLKPLMGHCRQTEHLVWCFTCSAMVTRCSTASHTMDCGSRLAHSRNWDASMAGFPLLWGGERKGLLRAGTQL